MWYIKDEPIRNEYELYDALYYIIEADDLCVDDYIDDLYPPFCIFDVHFYASDIVRKVDPYLYDMIIEELKDDWVKNTLDEINRYELSDGVTVAEILDYNTFEELQEIVWRDEGDKND